MARGGSSLNELQAEWDEKLKASGFDDIESRSGKLKTHDQRTQSFQDRDSIIEYGQRLNRFLARTELPTLDAKILELHSEGIQNRAIALKLECSESKVTKTLRKYRPQILSIGL